MAWIYPMIMLQITRSMKPVTGFVTASLLLEDEALFIQMASDIARTEGIFLATSPYVFHTEPTEADHNKLLLFDPAGDIALTHFKYGGNFLEGSKTGDGILRSIDTSFGRLAGLICWDQDFPAVVRQSGMKNVDILLAPSADWAAITPIHSAVGCFRAVENGTSLVRQNVNGLSLIVDPKGRILSSMNHRTSDQWVTTAQVPTRVFTTVYSSIGDGFAWVCGLYLLAMAFLDGFARSEGQTKSKFL